MQQEQNNKSREVSKATPSAENRIENTAVSTEHSKSQNTSSGDSTTAPSTDTMTAPSNEEKTKSHRPPFWGDVVVMILLFFLTQFAGTLISNAIGLTPSISALDGGLSQEAIDEASAEAASRYIASSFSFAMVLCLILLSLYRKWRGWGRIITIRTPGWATSFRLLCAYALMWCFSIATEPFAALLGEAPEQVMQGGWLLFSAVIIAPIFEETIFRGYIAGTLRKAYGAVAAWIVSSLLFGLAHGAPSTALTAFFSGLILCYCYMRHRSLVMAILLHAMNNATACFMMNIGIGESSMRQLIANDQIYWIVFALCLSISIIAIARMWQNIKSLENNKYLP